MEALVITWRELLYVVIAVLVIYVVELLLVLRWSGVRGASWLFKPKTGPETASNEGLLQEVCDLRRQVTRLQGEVDRLQSAPVVTVSPYNLAIQMARQGAGAGEVASGCGISRGEAELIVALYRKLRI